MKSSLPDSSSEIVFFDGVCNLCNGFVDFIIRRNTDLKFASLQSEAAARLLPPQLTKDLTSVVFQTRQKNLKESTAALMILMRLGGLWPMFGILLFLPPFVRDPVYRFIARHRYFWFGKRDSCRLPTAEERRRFLD